MKPQVLVGAAIGAVFVAAGFLAPSLRSSASKTAAAALAKAGDARNTLNQYDGTLPPLGARSDIDALVAADLQPLHDLAKPSLDELAKQFEQYAQDARRRDENTTVTPLSTDIGGMHSGVAGLQALLNQNEALAKKALDTARDANRTGADVPGVAQIVGIVEYLRAQNALRESQSQRLELEVKQNELMTLAEYWLAVQAEGDHFESLDYSAARDILRDDLESLTSDEAAASAEAAELRETIAEREQTLAKVNADLEQARADLLTLEEQSFTAGKDDEFNAYREKYLALTNRLRTLQVREQELTFGGLRGARIEGDDLNSGAIKGGERVDGLLELKRRLAVVEEKATRLAAAAKRVEQKSKTLGAAQQTAKDEAARYQSQITEAKTALQGVGTELIEVATKAFDQEAVAIQSAQAARSAFRSSQSAVDRAQRDARELQGKKDPQRQNDRLKMLVDDRYGPQFGKSAEAASRILEARVHAQRYHAISELIVVLDRTAEMTGSKPLDVSSLKDTADTAYDAAIQALTDAKSSYDGLVGRAPGETKWVPQASLATVYFLLSKIDLDASDQHFADAVASIREAVQGRERSPFLARAVQFRDFLKKMKPAAFSVGAGDEMDMGDDPDDGL